MKKLNKYSSLHIAQCSRYYTSYEINILIQTNICHLLVKHMYSVGIVVWGSSANLLEDKDQGDYSSYIFTGS